MRGKFLAMSRGRHRHSPPLHKLLPPSAIACVSVTCTVVSWFSAEPMVLRGLAACAAVAAVVGSVVMRGWDRVAGRRVAELTRARDSEGWRHEERVAELEADLEESRDLRMKLERKLRSKRTELAALRNEHAVLLRRYATAETERASALEGRRLLALEAAPVRNSLPAAPEGSQAGEGTQAGERGRGGEGSQGGERDQAGEGSRGDAHSGAAATAQVTGDAYFGAAAAARVTAGQEPHRRSAWGPDGRPERSEGAGQAPPETRLESQRENRPGPQPAPQSDTQPAPQPATLPEPRPAPRLENEPVTEQVTERTTEPANSREGRGAARSATQPASVQECEPVARLASAAPECPATPSPALFQRAGAALDALAARAASAERAPWTEGDTSAERIESAGLETSTGMETSTGDVQEPATGVSRPAGHYSVPPAAAVVPPAAPMRPAPEGGFDFFGNKGAPHCTVDTRPTEAGSTASALQAAQNDDLADVVGEEALMLHKAAAEAEFRPATAAERGLGQVIDLTAHDETEQLDLSGLRGAVS